MTETTPTPPPAIEGIAIAIVVADLDGAVQHFRTIFGLGEPMYATSAADKVEVAVFVIGNSQFQLVTPTDDESLIAQHISRSGEGLHHVGLVVSDVDAMLEQLNDRGARTLGNKGRPGAGDFRVGFVHPKSTYGALFELIETP